MSTDRGPRQAGEERVSGKMGSQFAEDDLAKKAQVYDFRRPDRIAKDQLRAIHLLHESFSRSLSASLSAYLRNYALVTLRSVEQLSFIEFSRSLPAPTCIVSIGIRPFDGNAILEINPSLVFPILEMLLGGTGKGTARPNREVTEIEQSILESLFRIVLHDLKEAWSTVTSMSFTIEAFKSEAQLLQILAPTEAVVAVSLEVRVGENSGRMNIGMPSIIIKMLRQRFDQQWSMRKSESTPTERERMFSLIKPSILHLDARLQGPTLTLEDLLAIEEGDVLTFDYPLEKPLDLLVNGKLKYRGRLATQGRKKALQISDLYRPVE
ncbi:MAG: flagellar motor switch protein FliM [Bryobacteraceae bacterium]|nr:flagellar motor switch protein FliM [Bryobacteraceae bacterium]MDW8379154.1 flagellar motor switch protein FliM [Bryobacterales bacterium]